MPARLTPYERIVQAGECRGYDLERQWCDKYQIAGAVTKPGPSQKP